MLRRSSPAARGGVALLVLAALGAAGCGTDPRDDYAAGWDAICADVGAATATFRADVSAAAKTSADAGDATVARGLRPDAVAGDLATPARKLDRALRSTVDAARALDAPEEWASWHAGAVQRLTVRVRAVDDAVQRLQGGDPDALAGTAVGSVGPADVRAPAGLRDRTPECTVLR
ncbi:hypothetical protein [Patulibacter sp. SYSU D01012]|uniref:hypothetical protein n=1 Tax=Patulibacter sp. SYSU D01012 TaxID=2817381 RepID=UPI001B30047F|nr:hypothetical protein [Patulibacter sp. SYSU D01012]